MNYKRWLVLLGWFGHLKRSLQYGPSSSSCSRLHAQQRDPDNEYTPLNLNYRVNNKDVEKVLDTDSVMSIGKYLIKSTTGVQFNRTFADEPDTIFLTDTKSGWGCGRHPTTKLCLEYIYNNVQPGDVVMDYGCGSGILSILALKLGASKVVAVDIDEDTIQAARNNFEINSCAEFVDLCHTSEVWTGNDRFPKSDITVANILPGALTRLVVPLWSFTKEGASICLSGMRPKDLEAVRERFVPFVELSSEGMQESSHPQFGQWIRWTVKTKKLTREEKTNAYAMMTELSME